MIDLSILLTLLDAMRAEVIDGLATPSGRDAFAFGEVSGQMRLLADFRGRLEEKINELYQENEEDR
jgi:hypothetical protein